MYTDDIFSGGMKADNAGMQLIVSARLVDIPDGNYQWFLKPEGPFTTRDRPEMIDSSHLMAP